jgi:hypothetical protein
VLSRAFPFALLAATLSLIPFLVSCGAVGSATAPPASTISVTPTSAQPFQGETVQFQAEVLNASASAVQWQVNQMPGGNSSLGTIDASGLYTAPAQIPNPPTVTVSAVLQSDSTKIGSASVTVRPLSSITGTLTLSPTLTSVTTSQSVPFSILAPPGVTPTDATWAATGGTISADGQFTPPLNPGPYTVLATLMANPSVTGSATVEVTDFPGTLTWRNDNARSGVNDRELALAPGNVNSSRFGKLFSCPIDGYAYAQPLYVSNLTIAAKGAHNVVIVATEKDSVYAFDADDKACNSFWRASLIPPESEPIEFPNLQNPASNIVPSVGITGTPAIDGTTSTLYVVAASQTIPVAPTFNPTYSVKLFAIDLTTGLPEIQPAGAEISVPPGQNAVFRPLVENQRPALLLDNGVVYVGFGSYGGEVDYNGWLLAYDSATLQLKAFFNTTPGTTQGGIWQSGGGPSADANHMIYFGSGDGPPNAGVNYSDSFVKLALSSGLAVADSLTPCDQGQGWGVNPDATLQSMSSAPLLADVAGQAPHLLIGGSRQGLLYVVNRDQMGGFPVPCSDAPPRVQAIPTSGPIVSTPLLWNSSVYVAPGTGYLVSYFLNAGTLSTTPSGLRSPEALGAQGATPVISSNGAANGILWLIDTSGAQVKPATPAILRAYDPDNLSNEIYNSAAASHDQAGPAVKFTVPTVANGKVYIGTQTELDVYGLK